jgi:hypothetical protein
MSPFRTCGGKFTAHDIGMGVKCTARETNSSTSERLLALLDHAANFRGELQTTTDPGSPECPRQVYRNATLPDAVCSMALVTKSFLRHRDLVNPDRRTILKICSSVLPQNGGSPLSRMYRMTPRDHMSA